MKHSLLFLVFALSPLQSLIADNIDDAVKDLCACGFPPSSSCFDELQKKYPEIDQNPSMQDEVMNRVRGGECSDVSQSSGGSLGALVGNKNLDESALPAGVADALKGIDQVVSDTTDCSTDGFSVKIPEGWQCRKRDKGAQDVTLHTDSNQLNVSLGKNQGRTSCSAIPICKVADISLSSQFSSKVYTNRFAGTYEYAGSYVNDDSFKITITSNTQPKDSRMKDIQAILDSFKVK